MQTQSISFTNYPNGGLGSNGSLANGNSQHAATMTNDTGELTPVINIQQPVPPAISVVTFRWDTSTDAHKDSCRGAPDR